MNVEQWKQQGSVYIWRYEPKNKNFPGWHMSADTMGYESLIQLLKFLPELSYDPKRTVILSKNTEYIAHPTLPMIAEEKLLVFLSTEKDTWNLFRKEGKLNFEIGENKAIELIAAIEKAKKGENDFSIGYSKNQDLWFW